MEASLIQKASFNSSIKTYILLVVAFFMAITIVGIPFLLIWFLGLGQLISKKYYDSLECQLTERHLEFRKGVMFKVEKTIPLENIQDLTFIENPLLKLLDLRVLKIETAGQSNPQGSDMKLVGIIDSMEFKRKVLEQRELLRNSNSSSGKSDTGDNKSIKLLTEIRDLLQEIKNK